VNPRKKVRGHTGGFGYSLSASICRRKKKEKKIVAKRGKKAKTEMEKMIPLLRSSRKTNCEATIGSTSNTKKNGIIELLGPSKQQSKWKEQGLEGGARRGQGPKKKKRRGWGPSS